uniref:Transcriptional repressor CTCF n=1 Tax=Ceratitis capitata TaxID=7213 RepID=W8BM03_CERCA
MSGAMDDDSEGQDLETIIHSINKEIEEVTLCLTDDMNGNEDESQEEHAPVEISIEDEDKQYYLDDRGNIYLTLTSSKTDEVPTSSKRKTKSVSESTSKRMAKSNKAPKASTKSESGEENFMIYINDDKIKSEVEQSADDPATLDEMYEFDELEEETESPAKGEKISLLKVLPVKSSELSGAQIYKCAHCNYETCKRYMLSRHMKSHSDDRPFVCSVCDRAFKTNHTLQNHINVHLGRKPHPCLSCDSRFTTQGDLSRHVMYKHTHTKRHKCTECDYATVEMSKLRRHMRAHTGERPYQCPHCTYASPDSFKLKRHLRTHTGEKPYECDICQSRFTQSNSLKSHKLIHSVDDKPVFQCALCPTTCSRKSDLRTHVQKLHYSDKPLPCKRCGKELPDRYSYKMHVKTHEGERCYSCNQCNYKSISMRNLEMHKQIHSEEKPFECEKCGHRFRQKQLLGRHINLYHNENYVPPPKLQKSHNCPYCTRVFAHKGNLVRHMRLHDDQESGTHSLRIPKVENEKLSDSDEEPYATDDDTMNGENFEEYDVIEEVEELETDLAIEADEPTTSQSPIQNNSKTLHIEMAKENKRNTKHVKIEEEFISDLDDDESGVPGYMVVKVDDDGDCVILTNVENGKTNETTAVEETSLNVENNFGFSLEECNDDDMEETVFLNIVEEN